MKHWELFVIPTFFLFFISGCSDSASFSQPIAYNHKKHIEEAGLGCFDCHTQVLTHQKANIPNVEFCKNCHETPMTDSKEEEKLIGYIKNINRSRGFKYIGCPTMPISPTEGMSRSEKSPARIATAM